MKHLRVIFVLLALGLAGCGPASATSEPPESEKSEADTKTQSAMSAAPMSIARDATIVDYPEKAGQPLIELREGTNGWTCFPDWKATPGKDPMCFDKMWMRWFEALTSGTDPDIEAPGIAYMLQGGSDASNTDPSAMKPPPGEDWVSAPPHLMLIVPGKLDTDLFSTDHHSGGPWVMYAGTPYEHLMVPVEGEIEGSAHVH